MNGGYGQQARILCKVMQAHRADPLRRTSSDDVWPLRRADGTKFHEKRSGI